jgi:hypothetical protein
VGTYTITCARATSHAYSISYVAGTLTITQAAQRITFAALPNQTLGAAPITVHATGGASGNPVTFSAGPGSVCTAGGTNGATITLLGTGSCTVIATQAGTANYQAAPGVAQSFVVSGWTAGSALPLSRVGLTATLVPSGQVLVAGGRDPSGAMLASALLFNPTTGATTQTGAMTTARGFATASLLVGGQVLVAGGVVAPVATCWPAPSSMTRPAAPGRRPAPWAPRASSTARWCCPVGRCW